MTLKECGFPLHYATSTTDLIESFYIPALKTSIKYSRGVGFFSSGWFALAAEGLAGLANNGGTARIITSPILSSADWEAFRTGSRAAKDEVLLAALREAVQSLARDLKADTLVALAWMIADQLLEIRLALPSAELDGDFHDKFGTFVDGCGDVVAFHGSPNDSRQAFRNYESISIFCSWVCTGGQVNDGNGNCACPSGQTWNGSACVDASACNGIVDACGVCNGDGSECAHPCGFGQTVPDCATLLGTQACSSWTGQVVPSFSCDQSGSLVNVTYDTSQCTCDSN